MRKQFTTELRGRNGGTLNLEEFAFENGHVTDGVLREEDGYWYPIISGVPCFLRGGMRPNFEEFRTKHNLPQFEAEDKSFAQAEQSSTTVTFSDKWRRFKRYGFEPSHEKFLFEWYCKKLGLNGLDELKEFYRKKNRILECGPGSGFNTRFMAENCDGEVFSLDISEAAFTASANVSELSNCSVVQADLMDAPFDDDYFDFIIADGVLHHTPDTRLAVRALYEKLAPGGQFYFYVYREMGPLRRFSDDYVRDQFTQMDPESCYAECEGFTELGKQLSDLNAKVTLEKGIPILGIPPGEHDVQRLIYYNVMKCFWNDAFDWETNNMVNFDWYHPHNAWQHSEDEVADWLSELGVKEFSFNDSNPNGISVLLRKPA